MTAGLVDFARTAGVVRLADGLAPACVVRWADDFVAARLAAGVPVRFAAGVPVRFAADRPVCFAADRPVRFAADVAVRFAAGLAARFAAGLPVRFAGVALVAARFAGFAAFARPRTAAGFTGVGLALRFLLLTGE